MGHGDYLHGRAYLEIKDRDLLLSSITPISYNIEKDSNFVVPKWMKDSVKQIIQVNQNSGKHLPNLDFSKLDSNKKLAEVSPRSPRSSQGEDLKFARNDKKKYK